jgi:hypothetical protein
MSFVAMSMALLIAAGFSAPFTWDGAYYFFNMLNTLEPAVEHGRVAERYLHYPVVWALEYGGSIPLSKAVFNGIHVISPLAALVLSWWVVRKRAPELLIWPMLCIGLALLPGQINFISSGIKAVQLMWPLLLALMIGLPNRTIPISCVLAAAIYILHPVAAPILAACGLAALILSLLRRGDRWRLALSGAALVVAGLVRFLRITSGYDQSEMTWATQSRQWSNGATGLPMIALIVCGCIALTILLQPWLTSEWRQWLTRAQVGGVVVAVIALLFWAADPSQWWEALEFRGPSFWISMIMAGCLFLHVLIAHARQSVPAPQSASVVLAIALGFSLVIAIQSFTWHKVVNDLERQMSTRPRRALPAKISPVIRIHPSISGVQIRCRWWFRVESQAMFQ